MSANKTSGMNDLYTAAEAQRRQVVRYFAVALSAATAVIYFMIGFNIISVLDTPSDQIFGLFAGAAYALGVVMLVMYDRRMVWILGALFQAFVIFMYFNLASQRSPAYEVWGILLRVPQVMIFVALAYLSTRRSPAPTSDSVGGNHS